MAKAFLGGEKEAFDKANDELEKYPITIDDQTNVIEEIRTQCEASKI